MSRDIKFRGKSIRHGEWKIGDLITETDGLNVKRMFIISPVLCSDDSKTSKPMLYEVDPETVGQYTGLKDRNGIEIYEGDVLDCNNHWNRVVIEWHNAGFRGKYYDHKDDVCYAMIASAPPEGIEVIGNAWEHPHLLAGKEQSHDD